MRLAVEVIASTVSMWGKAMMQQIQFSAAQKLTSRLAELMTWIPPKVSRKVKSTPNSSQIGAFLTLKDNKIFMYTSNDLIVL